MIFRIYRSKQWYHVTFERKSHFRIGVIAIGLCIWKRLYLVIFVSAFVTFESFTFLSRLHTCRDFSLPISFQSFHLIIEYDLVTTVRLDLMVWGRRLCLHQNHSILLTVHFKSFESPVWYMTGNFGSWSRKTLSVDSCHLSFTFQPLNGLYFVRANLNKKTSRLGNHFYDF